MGHRVQGDMETIHMYGLGQLVSKTESGDAFLDHWPLAHGGGPRDHAVELVLGNTMGHRVQGEMETIHRYGLGQLVSAKQRVMMHSLIIDFSFMVKDFAITM